MGTGNDPRAQVGKSGKVSSSLLKLPRCLHGAGAGGQDRRQKKPLSAGKGSQRPGRVRGDIGDPLPSSHQASLQASSRSLGHASPVLAWSCCPWLYPLSPGYSLKDKQRRHQHGLTSAAFLARAHCRMSRGIHLSWCVIWYNGHQLLRSRPTTPEGCPELSVLCVYC